LENHTRLNPKSYAKDNQGSPMANVIVSVFTDFPENGGLLMAKGTTDNNGFFGIQRPVSGYYKSIVLATTQIGLIDFIEVPIVNGKAEYTFGGVSSIKKSGSILKPKNASTISATINYLGTFDGNGVPHYLEPINDAITASFLNDLDNSFPSGQDLRITHPDYLSTDYEHDLLLECSTDVWVTFVSEGAGYRNVLGFYTYDLSNPPANENDITDITIIFPNTSFAGSGGGLYAGNKVKIGTFAENTGIGWVLIADGWTGTGIDDGYNYLYSERDFNPETDIDLRQHSVMVYDPGRNLTVLAWEDIQRDNAGSDPSSCDQDFNDVIYYITTSPEPCAVLDFPVIDYDGADLDSDDIPDAYDDYPNDPLLAFNNYYPCGIAYGSLAFEDLWPGLGDYDFNDLVIDYNYNQVTNSENKIVKIDAKYIVKAQGASLENGFGVEFDIAQSAIASISGQDLQEGYISTNANGTESGQSKAVLIAFDNAYNQLPSPGSGIGANTQPGLPYVTPGQMNIEIVFDQPYTQAEVGFPPYNPFIIINADRNLEVHLPNHAPTQLASLAYLGTEQDNSQPSIGRYYKTENNLPWAIDIWYNYSYPVEKAEITAAHLKFSDWAQSDGDNYPDWFKDLPGYRNTSYIYVIP
jgi:LruC domain-containing protein